MDRSDSNEWVTLANPKASESKGVWAPPGTRLPSLIHEGKIEALTHLSR